MRAVAEWLVPRSAAAAERDAIAHLVLPTVGALYAHVSAYPNRPATLHSGILDKRNRRLDLRFDHLACSAVTDDEPPRRTVRCLVRDDTPHFAVVASLDQLPDRSSVVAEARVCAERAIVVECHRRSGGHFRFAIERFARGGFGAVKANAFVRSIAKWLR